VFATQDNNGRYRMLKYSPEHMHCLACVWGPLAPPNTGVLAVQRLEGGQRGWRVAATGVVLQLDASLRVVKKLKLVGTPYKVRRGGGQGLGRGLPRHACSTSSAPRPTLEPLLKYSPAIPLHPSTTHPPTPQIHRHTAFINGMFNSLLEASKFEGASVRTVSGIRGTIKKAVKAGREVRGGGGRGAQAGIAQRGAVPAARRGLAMFWGVLSSHPPLTLRTLLLRYPPPLSGCTRGCLPCQL
jgi:ribosome biogenesis protein BMS1